MLTAERMSMWRGRYQIAADGRPVAVWDPSWWRSGGDFEVEGRRFQVRGGTWGTKYHLLDEAGGEVVIGVQIAIWRAQRTAAAAGS